MLFRSVGNQASFNSTGEENTAVGHAALLSNTTGAYNTAVGYGAGWTGVPANANTTGSRNTFVGYLSGPASPTQHGYMTTLGAGASGDCDNCIVLGQPGDGTIESRRILGKTTNYSVAATDGNTFFTNSGVQGTVNFTLPTPIAGLTYTFYVDAARMVQVTASAGATIQVAGYVSLIGGNASNATSGSVLQLVAISTTRWVAESYAGPWVIK